MFFKGSRYEKIGELERTGADGRRMRYKATRFIPSTRPSAPYVVKEGDRIDRVAFQFFRNPERFWRICDANDALWPPDLLIDPGDRIGIPRSES
jgi:hypothetical protein